MLGEGEPGPRRAETSGPSPGWTMRRRSSRPGQPRSRRRGPPGRCPSPRRRARRVSPPVRPPSRTSPGAGRSPSRVRPAEVGHRAEVVEDQALVEAGPLGDGPGAGAGVAIGLQRLDRGIAPAAPACRPSGTSPCPPRCSTSRTWPSAGPLTLSECLKHRHNNSDRTKPQAVKVIAPRPHRSAAAMPGQQSGRRLRRGTSGRSSPEDLRPG